MENCPVCKSGIFLIWKEKAYRAYMCKKCRVAFLHPLPENPSAIYNGEYFNKWYIKYYSERKAYNGKLFSMVQRYAGRKGKLLDVGCGAGIFMEAAREKGWDVYGQDISPFAITHCRGRGYAVYDRPLPETCIEENSFDVITMMDVIAHLKDPVSYIRYSYKLLKPGGYLVIKTPHYSVSLFLLANLLSFTGKSRALLHIPAQIFHPAKQTFMEIAERENFTIASCRDLREFSFPLLRSLKVTVSGILKFCRFEKSMFLVLRKNMKNDG